MIVDRSYSARNVWSWLLVATIFLHALLPLGSPLARTNGSPFSASTIEVSTTPSRSTTALHRQKVDEPGPDAAPAFLPNGPATAAPFRRTAIGRPERPTANPPWRRGLLLPLGARAPPIS